jgi:stage II sporulation protein AB (anti-sigma F factor)
MKHQNRMELTFLSQSVNEAFARVTVAAFIAQLNPTMDELADIKTVISEAVTNSIIHGYDNRVDGLVTIIAVIENESVTIEISDNGQGIDNLELARQPMYTSKPELERSGMGFTIMENFMDECTVTSAPNEGTKVVLRKTFATSDALLN